MRILMIYANQNRMLCPAPIGSLLVAERLYKDGHDVRFLDLMHEKNPREALIAVLDAHRPELTCLSIRNVDSQSMEKPDHPVRDASQWTAIIREKNDGPILIGGTAVTTFPEQIRKDLGADYALAGDDLDNISRFVNSLARGVPDFETPGLVAEKDGRAIRNSFSICGYANAHFSGFERVNLSAYRKKGYYDCGLVTHSGCPMGCSFCDSHRTFGREYVLRDIKIVVEELTELRRRHKARSVWLINTGINRPMEYGKELLVRIIEARLGLALGCLIEPGVFDAELARLMYRAGCTMPMIFCSTLSDAVLERNQPFYRAKDVVESARMLRDAGLDFLLGQMYGAPGETVDTVRRSLDLADNLKPAMIVTGFGFRIQPETPLREVAVREGVIDEKDDGYAPKFYVSPETSAEELAGVIKNFRRTHLGQYLRMAAFIGRSIKESVFGRREIK